MSAEFAVYQFVVYRRQNMQSNQTLGLQYKNEHMYSFSGDLLLKFSYKQHQLYS